MPRFGPTRRVDLIAAFRALGFTGPHSGTRHDFMQRGTLRVRIPNRDIDDRDLLREILRQAGVTRAEWESVQNQGPTGAPIGTTGAVTAMPSPRRRTVVLSRVWGFAARCASGRGFNPTANHACLMLPLLVPAAIVRPR